MTPVQGQPDMKNETKDPKNTIGMRLLIVFDALLDRKHFYPILHLLQKVPLKCTFCCISNCIFCVERSVFLLSISFNFWDSASGHFTSSSSLSAKGDLSNDHMGLSSMKSSYK